MYIFDVREGVAGDMILSALIDTGAVPAEEISHVLETAARVMDPTAKVIIRKELAGGDSGTSLSVLHWKFDEVSARSMQRHLNMAIKELMLQKIRWTTAAILDTILNAESEVHNVPVDELHLHETGSPDTLVDIIGVCHMLDKLGAEFTATPVAVGKGRVKIEHGTFDVPPPATAIMLKEMQWSKGPFDGEMATPTGVAILKNVIKGHVREIDPRAVKIGTGFGSKTYSGKRTAVRLYRV